MQTYPLARDIEVVRDILRWAQQGGFEKDKPAHSDLSLAVHIKMMVDADLIDGIGEYRKIPGLDEYKAMIFQVKCLKWKGAEFWEALQNDTIWHQVKSQTKEHGIPLLFDLAASLARGFASQHGLQLG